tara:strand:+ start:205 stop:534 length:330 start_codon:yes stop_codon:yes gene_type:complete
LLYEKKILFLITITTFTNVSYASFPVVEKVSNQTTGSPDLFAMEGTTLIIWSIVVFTLFFLTILNFLKNGWRRRPWWLYLWTIGVGYFTISLGFNLFWRGLTVLLFGSS